ncbi:hypothetical protein ACNOYE_11465 [Nannocystaceae bacterium ST9]
MKVLELGHPASFLIAALIGLVAGACGPHSEYRIEKVCKKHCARVVDCNDTIEFDDCVSDCIDISDDCDSDADIEQALDILETCPEEACNDVPGCATEAWVECTF